MCYSRASSQSLTRLRQRSKHNNNNNNNKTITPTTHPTTPHSDSEVRDRRPPNAASMFMLLSASRPRRVASRFRPASSLCLFFLCASCGQSTHHPIVRTVAIRIIDRFISAYQHLHSEFGPFPPANWPKLRNHQAFNIYTAKLHNNILLLCIIFILSFSCCVVLLLCMCVFLFGC